MTRRYGRNQKRAHRERIAELERECVRLRKIADSNADHARSALYRAQNARAEALTDLLQNKEYIDLAVDVIAHELGAAMGPHYKTHVDKLIAAREPRGVSTFKLRGIQDQDDMRRPVLTIEGKIEALFYRFRMAP